MASDSILDPSELSAHLDLLRAFHDLKSRVEAGKELEFNANPEERWESFVQTSVEKCIVTKPASCGVLKFHFCRFHRWVSGLRVHDNDVFEGTEHPSLDICLVWHAYMLNPG
jgi:hypothetical protein